MKNIGDFIGIVLRICIMEIGMESTNYSIVEDNNNI